MPDSITARVALAGSWVGYAADARGDGYADTVSQENWKLFKERVANAHNELIEAKKLEQKSARSGMWRCCQSH